MFDVHSLEEFFFEAFRDRFDVHIIAITSSFATTVDVLFAFSIQEVSDWRVYGTDFFAIKKSTIDAFQGILRVVLITVLDIDVADDVISQVINNDHILDLSILTHLFENLLEKMLVPK